MRKSIQSQFLMMMTTVVMVASTFTESSAQKVSKPSFAQEAVTKINKGFRFEINAVHCYAGGVSLYVVIDKPTNYAFLWEIDGMPGGHQMNQECISGEYAKLRVMRLSDGFQITRTVRLSTGGYSPTSN